MGTRVEDADYFVLNLKTRMPFKYGIATLEAIPHVFLKLCVRIDGHMAHGISAEGLPPKWFTKDPDQSYSEEIADMIGILRLAARTACSIGEAASPFAFWRALDRSVREAAGGMPPLLLGLGVSMVERAVIDAFCRYANHPFSGALSQNTLGIDLAEMHPELGGTNPRDWLPATPQSAMIVRHTVGLADPLRRADVAPEEELRDGLPQAFEDVVSLYGICYAKVKVSGDLDRDVGRLSLVLRILEDAHGSEFGFTLDGNEHFRDIAEFLLYARRLFACDAFRRHRERLLFFEQPFHRSVALAIDIHEIAAALSNPVPFIIDESDATQGALRRGLDLGYAGTSHKNCKGVFKSVANACLLEWKRRKERGSFINSSEDLVTVGPVALLQDLAVAAALGITHSERNGHHYFRGLSMFPDIVQGQVLAHHDTLYRTHPEGYPTLAVEQGKIELDSINSAPFGYGFDLEPAILGDLDDWSIDSLYDL